MIRRPPISTLFPYPPLFRSEPPDPNLEVPTYWIRPFQPLAGTAGMHRFVWDLHGTPTPGGEYPISAIYRDTPHAQGEWMPPGDRKSTRLNSSHLVISYAVFC